MSATTPKKEPTASEAMFFFAIVKHTRNKADIDWAAVATEQGFKNADVAKVRFGQVKRKLGINDTSGAAKTPTKSGVASGRVAKTPTRRGNGKVKQVKTEDIDNEGSCDAGVLPPSTPGGGNDVKPELDYPVADDFADL
ncbi:hypothetical protein NLU13_6325 [Sarocladium strictum]|uniref:Myb-like DNA-binding domain-containing protein n=1 Tax=Sarocladium strictum TaxID=5046 RepID=A0AA39GFP2_SARSR|nr:hypothetical protein NLU13_6325 [Sarocladium strictum]